VGKKKARCINVSRRDRAVRCDTIQYDAMQCDLMAEDRRIDSARLDSKPGREKESLNQSIINHQTVTSLCTVPTLGAPVAKSIDVRYLLGA
jgi:hypothetical protein